MDTPGKGLLSILSQAKSKNKREHEKETNPIASTGFKTETNVLIRVEGPLTVHLPLAPPLNIALQQLRAKGLTLIEISLCRYNLLCECRYIFFQMSENTSGVRELINKNM